MTNLTTEGRNQANRNQAHQAILDNLDLLSDLFRLRHQGKTLRACAQNLNDRGVKTRQDGDWSATQVMRLLDRVTGKVEFTLQTYSKSIGWIDQETFPTYDLAAQAMAKLDRKKEYRIDVNMI